MDGQLPGKPIRLLLLANQALFRASLGRLLASEPNLEVVAECSASEEALATLSGSGIDVVLLDCDDGTEAGNTFMSAARRDGFQGRFLVITSAADLANSAVAIKLGASGVFLKSEAPDRLVQAITLVANGAAWLDQKTLRVLADQSVERFVRLDGRESRDLLTARGQKVLLGILGGLTN